jgi:hypothetical protein
MEENQTFFQLLISVSEQKLILIPLGLITDRAIKNGLYRFTTFN